MSWNTSIGKECTRELRRLLIKPESEPFLFVSVTFLSNETWWPLPFVDIKLYNQVNQLNLSNRINSNIIEICFYLGFS